MASTTDALGTTTWSYDLAGRPLKKTLPDARFIGWAYDADGRITERSSPAGTVRYGFDANGRLASVTDPAGRITGYTWNAAGELSRVHYPNGTETRSEYDAAGRISQKAHLRTSSGELIAATRYTYTGGQRSTVEVFDGASSAIEVDGQLQLANPVRSTDYGYDELQRLVSETLSVRASTEVREIAYVYDAVGNRTRRTVTIGASTLATDYTFDANDRLSTETSTDALGNATTSSYAWDQNGNLESKSTPSGVTLYGWDSENRLIEVRRGADEASASTVATYAYDADGLRIRRTEPGSPPRVTDYLTDPSFPFAQVLEETETLGTATETTHYVWGAELIEQLRGGQGTFYHADALGSVKALTDEAGATSDLYEYEAFGELASHAGASDNAYRYTGEYFDGVMGLQYNRARWYSAEVGRWTAMDPIEGELEFPTSQNDYAYALNSPILRSDPSGKTSLMDVSSAMNTLSRMTTISVQNLTRTTVRQVLVGRPSRGEFGLVGEVIIQMMMSAVEGAVGNTARGFGDNAHRRLDKAVKQLNRWVGQQPFLSDLSIEAELYRDRDRREVAPRSLGSVGLDVVVKYRGRIYFALDMKTGRTGWRPGKRRVYQRRFGPTLWQVFVSVDGSRTAR